MSFVDRITDFFKGNRKANPHNRPSGDGPDIASNEPSADAGGEDGGDRLGKLEGMLGEVLDLLRRQGLERRGEDEVPGADTRQRDRDDDAPERSEPGGRESLGDELNRTGRTELPDDTPVVWGLQGGDTEGDVPDQSPQRTSHEAAVERTRRRREARGLDPDTGEPVEDERMRADEARAKDFDAPPEQTGTQATKLEQFHDILLDTQSKVTEIHEAIKAAES